MALPSRFLKMAGGGNDFLVFEADGRGLSEEERARLALVCRRGLSVGADGALFLAPGDKGRVRVDYFNADGGPATFCANGTRCAARFAIRRGLASGATAMLETGWGSIESRVEGETVTLLLPAVPAPETARTLSAGQKCVKRPGMSCTMLQVGRASFDRFRMRSFLCGIWQMPVSLLLILSLSKDARLCCRPKLRPCAGAPGRAAGRRRRAARCRVRPW